MYEEVNYVQGFWMPRLFSGDRATCDRAEIRDDVVLRVEKNGTVRLAWLC